MPGERAARALPEVPDEPALGGKQVIPARQLREMHSPQIVVKAEGAFASSFPADARCR